MKIVSKEAWEALRVKARLWWLGWIAAAAVTGLAGAVVLECRVVVAQLRELQLRQDSFDRQNYETAQVAKLVMADQQQTGKALLEAAKAVQVRAEIADLARRTTLIPRPHKLVDKAER